MTNRKFKTMKDVLTTAGSHDPVWWAGYLFLELTDKQIDILTDLFASGVNPAVKMCERNGRYGALLPSGLFLFKGEC